MIPVDGVQLIMATEARAPSWLMGPARYDGGPALRCRVDNVESIVSLSGDRYALTVINARDDDPWMLAVGARIDVEPGPIVSPLRGDIPPGAICIAGDEPCLSARYNHGEIYISLRTGEPIRPEYGRFVAFPHWQLSIDGADDERHVLYSSVPFPAPQEQ